MDTLDDDRGDEEWGRRWALANDMVANDLPLPKHDCQLAEMMVAIRLRRQFTYERLQAN